MQPFVDRTWVVLRNSNNENDFLELMEVFWSLKQTDTLLCIKEAIEAMEQKPTDIANIKFEPDTSASFPTVLNILRLFKDAEIGNFSIALNLLFDFINKQPENVPLVLHCLIEGFGFRPTPICQISTESHYREAGPVKARQRYLYSNC
jgi:hypothetical protein